jgi:hypothetical protein
MEVHSSSVAFVLPGKFLMRCIIVGYATLETRNLKAAFRSRTLPQVHGVLYRMHQGDFQKLKKKEGGYDVQAVRVSAASDQCAA